MGSKYELTLDTNYVSDWNIAQAVRELFQNSVDSEVQNPGNTSYWKGFRWAVKQQVTL